MIVCKHPDCGYKYGWSHRDSDDNVFYDSHGDFFRLETKSISSVHPTRFNGDVPHDLRLRGCPKCFRLSLVQDEYED